MKALRRAIVRKWATLADIQATSKCAAPASHQLGLRMRRCLIVKPAQVPFAVENEWLSCTNSAWIRGRPVAPAAMIH